MWFVVECFGTRCFALFVVKPRFYFPFSLFWSFRGKVIRPIFRCWRRVKGLNCFESFFCKQKSWQSPGGLAAPFYFNFTKKNLNERVCLIPDSFCRWKNFIENSKPISIMWPHQTAYAREFINTVARDYDHSILSFCPTIPHSSAAEPANKPPFSSPCSVRNGPRKSIQ